MSRFLDAISMPSAPGEYRWCYVDATCGEYTCVAIFMIGAVFLPSTVRGTARGELPDRHCAVNFALYRRGVRVAWVFSRHRSASVQHHSGIALRIGRSRLTLTDEGRALVEIDDRAAFGGRRVRGRVVLEARAPGHAPLPLDDHHTWQPLLPRAEATMELYDAEGTKPIAGHGYCDTNAGDEPLGPGLPGWRWARTHATDETRILYALPGPRSLRIVARAEETLVQYVPTQAVALRRSAWGLQVPVRCDTDAETDARVHAVPRFLESSPFYARYEAHPPGAHVLGEVADFRRFRSPWIRWMAHFRSRTAARA